MQTTIAVGFIAISQDLVNLLRTALVNSTRPSTDDDDDDITPSKLMSDSATPRLVILRISEGPENSQEDKPRQRYWYRRLSEFLFTGFLAALVTGVVGNSFYGGGVDKADKAALVMRLRFGVQNSINIFIELKVCRLFRYASSAISLFFSIVLGATAMWASKKIPRFKTSAGSLTLFMCCLFVSMPIAFIFRFLTRTSPQRTEHHNNLPPQRDA